MLVRDLPDSATFSSKGQIVIPSAIRRKFGISGGTRAHVEIIPDGILLKPVTRSTVENLMGKYAPLKIGTKELEAERRRDRRKEDEKRRP
jgi:AbrB family looped-hinge helix DNA binding protein